jgi:hypothetical protein
VLVTSQGDTNQGGESLTLTLRQRYVQASPPYDLGNGEIPLFIFAHMRADGSIGGLYIAEDPPWANNGPTSIRPDYVDPRTGKKYQRRRQCALSIADVKAGRCDMADLIAARREAATELVEITQAVKQADMHLHPHSWAVEPTEGEIVLLDPCCGTTALLHELQSEGEDVAALILDGYLAISPDACGAKAPPRTRAVRYRMKGAN